MNRRKREPTYLVSQLVLILAIALAAVISVREWVRLATADSVEFSMLLPSATLFGIGLVLVALVLDRHTLLSKISETLQQVLDCYVTGIRFLDNSKLVIREVILTVAAADRTIKVIGAKSTAKKYLGEIADRVTSGDIFYYRLLTGDHITHELHEHLDPLINMPSVFVAWNASEKYGNFTISEKKVVLVLPTPNPDEFEGVVLPGERMSAAYNDLFMAAYSSDESIKITTREGLSCLCEVCSPDTAGDEGSIRKRLAGIHNS